MVCPRIIDAGEAAAAKNEAILVAVVLADDTVITEVFKVETPVTETGPLLSDVADATPKAGVTSDGEVCKTVDPVPVTDDETSFLDAFVETGRDAVKPETVKSVRIVPLPRLSRVRDSLFPPTPNFIVFASAEMYTC